LWLGFQPRNDGVDRRFIDRKEHPEDSCPNVIAGIVQYRLDECLLEPWGEFLSELLDRLRKHAGGPKPNVFVVMISNILD